MGVHEFACLIPNEGGVKLPTKNCSNASGYTGKERFLMLIMAILLIVIHRLQKKEKVKCVV